MSRPRSPPPDTPTGCCDFVASADMLNPKPRLLRGPLFPGSDGGELGFHVSRINVKSRRLYLLANCGSTVASNPFRKPLDVYRSVLIKRDRVNCRDSAVVEMCFIRCPSNFFTFVKKAMPIYSSAVRSAANCRCRGWSCRRRLACVKSEECVERRLGCRS